MIRLAPSLGGRFARPGITAAGIGIAIGAMLLAFAIAIILHRVGDAAPSLLVQATGSTPQKRATVAATALGALRAAPAVRDAHQADPNEMASLLGLTPNAASDPAMPAMITVTLRPKADAAPLLATLRRMNGVTVTTPEAASDRPTRTLRGLRRLALLVAAAAALFLAGMRGIAADRTTTEILRELGASDGQIARQAAEAILPDALAGAAAGFLGTALLILIASVAEGALGLGGAGWALLALAAAGGAGVAITAAFIQTFVRLRRLP